MKTAENPYGSFTEKRRKGFLPQGTGYYGTD
jgi:hypothetical protein